MIVHLKCSSMSHVVDRAKAFLLDYIGYAASAVDSDCARVLGDVVDGFGGTAEATIIGGAQRTSVAWAALVNGALGHVNELDDTHGREGGPHADVWW